MDDKKTNHHPSSETNQISSIKDLSLLVNKPYIAYSFKKTQRISQAVYLLTDFLEATEPLRQALRTNAATLLQTATLFLKSTQKDTVHVAHQVIATLLETSALLETAHLVHMLSEGNFSILKGEINQLINVIEENKERPISISREFIETESLEDYKRQLTAYKGHIPTSPVKDNIKSFISPNISSSIRQKTDMVYRGSAKDFQSYINKIPLESKGQRLDRIVSLFKPGEELMIKDITIHFGDVSEKTIQRELLLLVAKGSLRKKGERRWSRYLLPDKS